MKAVQFSEYGGPQVLRLVDADEPHPGPGEVRIAVRAAGVNPIDWKFRSGTVPGAAVPSIPGIEAAGVVDEVGTGVAGVAVGDAVFGSTVGASAEYAVLRQFAAKPAGMSFEEAAGLTVAAETASRAFALLGLEAGRTLLINGAAGGVGTAAIQLARARGASVIGTASEPNHEYLRSLGATPTTYGEGLADRVAALAPHGVDRALDAAGHGAVPDLIKITGGPDRVVTIADYTAPQLGVRFTGGGAVRAWDALAEVAALFEQGRFTMPVARAFPLAEAAQAHALSEAGHVRGKIVLTISEGSTH